MSNDQQPPRGLLHRPVPKRLGTNPPGVGLCRLDELAGGQARGFVLEIGDGRFHGFVVRHREGVVGYVDRCPHMGLPSAKRLDTYVTPGGHHIICDWHRALFACG